MGSGLTNSLALANTLAYFTAATVTKKQDFMAKAPVCGEVKAAVLVAAVEGRHVPRAGERHGHVVAKQKNAEKRDKLEATGRNKGSIS
jgi:hypothetical protein